MMGDILVPHTLPDSGLYDPRDTSSPPEPPVRLVLIGDIHLFSLKLSVKDFLGKRALGQSNLWLNRRFRFNHALLEPLFERVRELKPDLVLCSGDVTTTSLDDEFHDIVSYFKPLHETVEVVIVPGNHDRYTFRSKKHRRVETLLEGMVPSEFPAVKRLNDAWKLLALDSARPQVMMSRGRIGSEQFEAIERVLAQTTHEEGIMVLCHYPAALPPGMPRSWMHDLKGARRLEKMLAACPARVVFVHGHIHKPWHHLPDERGKPAFEVLNAGAPCMTGGKYPLGQGFWEIELPEDVDTPLGLIHHTPVARDEAEVEREATSVHPHPQWKTQRL